MKTIGLVFLGIIFAYGGIAAFSELRLIHLLKTPELAKAEPVIYKEHTFYSQAEMEIYQEEMRRECFYPWAYLLREWAALALLAAAAGYIGGLIRLIVESQLDKTKIRLSSLLMGLVIGPVLVAVSRGYSELMMEGHQQFKPASVAAVCLLAGIAWERAWSLVKKAAESKYKE